MLHDSNARQILIMKLARDLSVPAHLSFDRPVGQTGEAVASRRTEPRGVDRRPGGDVAVAERHYDVWSEVRPLDRCTTRQRRRDVLSQSQLVSVGRRASFAVADLVQPLDTLRRNYSNNVRSRKKKSSTTHRATPNTNDLHSTSYMRVFLPLRVSQSTSVFAEFYGAHQKNLTHTVSGKMQADDSSFQKPRGEHLLQYLLALEDNHVFTITVAFTVILVVCRDFRYRLFFVVAVKISVLCVISAFERSLMYTRKPCFGRETARCRCKIRYASKFTPASRGSPCDSTALVGTTKYFTLHLR